MKKSHNIAQTLFTNDLGQILSSMPILRSNLFRANCTRIIYSFEGRGGGREKLDEEKNITNARQHTPYYRWLNVLPIWTSSRTNCQSELVLSFHVIQNGRCVTGLNIQKRVYSIIGEEYSFEFPDPRAQTWIHAWLGKCSLNIKLKCIK